MLGHLPSISFDEWYFNLSKMSEVLSFEYTTTELNNFLSTCRQAFKIPYHSEMVRKIGSKAYIRLRITYAKSPYT